MIGDVKTLYGVLLDLALGVGLEGEFRLTSPCVKKKAGFRNSESCPNLIGKLQPYDLAHRQMCLTTRSKQYANRAAAPPLTPDLGWVWSVT